MDLSSEKIARAFIVISFYALSLALFVSVSLISIYHVFTLMAFLLLLIGSIKNEFFTFQKLFNQALKSLPKSSFFLMAFIFWQIISGLLQFSDLKDPSRSLGSVKYPLIGLFSLFVYTQIAENKKHLKIALYLFCMSLIAAFLYGYKAVYFPNGFSFFEQTFAVSADGSLKNRLSGFTDIMRYGYGSALVLLLFIAMLIQTKKYKFINPYFLGITSLFVFLGLYLSYTRGAMLGFLLSLPVILFFYSRRLTYIVSTISLGIVAIMVIVSLQGGSESSRFLMNANNASNNIRKSQYISALYAFKENPWLGLGPLQFKHHVKSIKEKYNLEHKDYADHSHNVFLEIAASGGIIAVFSFIGWLLCWAYELWKKNTLARQLFLPVISYIFIAGQFEMLMMAQTSTLIYFLYAISQQRVFNHD